MKKAAARIEPTNKGLQYSRSDRITCKPPPFTETRYIGKNTNNG